MKHSRSPLAMGSSESNSKQLKNHQYIANPSKESGRRRQLKNMLYCCFNAGDLATAGVGYASRNILLNHESVLGLKTHALKPPIPMLNIPTHHQGAPRRNAK